MTSASFISSMLLLLYFKFFILISLPAGLKIQAETKTYPQPEFKIYLPSGSQFLQSDDKRKLSGAWDIRLFLKDRHQELSKAGFHTINKFTIDRGEDLNRLFLLNKNLRI